MVKVAGPAMSLEASGSLGKIMTFSKWKGRPYVRTLVRPSNPKSGGQVGVRSMFKFLAQNWAPLDAATKATWEERADQKTISTFNAYMSYNQFSWRDFTAPTQLFPATRSGTEPTIGAIVATAGVRSASIAIPITTLDDGWGVCVFRSLSSAFTTAFDNLIGIQFIDASATFTFVDTPLEPDTYYYNFRGFTDDGLLAAEEGEESVVIT